MKQDKGLAAGDRTEESAGERAVENVEGQAEESAGERAVESVEGQAGESAGEHAVENVEGQAEESAGEHAVHSMGERAAEFEEQHVGPQETPHTDHHTEQHNPVHAPIPGLGFRSIKTALAAAFTALLYAFLPNSNPTFACIGAIFGMGADMEESRLSGGNRFFGTVIGGFIGLGLYWLEHAAYPEGCYWLRLPMVFLGIIALISMCVLFHWPGGVQPGGVVLCIILFNTPAHHIDYAIHRMIDTGVGVVIALLVNYLLPRSRLERWFHLEQR